MIVIPEEAFENVGMSMFGYMTDIETVEMKQQVTVEAKGKVKYRQMLNVDVVR